MWLCSIGDESQENEAAGFMHVTHIVHEFINKYVLSKQSDVNRAWTKQFIRFVQHLAQHGTKS